MWDFSAISTAERGRLYHRRRRVQRRYRSIEPRETVRISLHTASETIARSKADRAWSQMIEAWEARLAGNSAHAEAHYEAARDLARARGFRFLDAGAVSELPVSEVVERVEAIPTPSNQPDAIEAAALLGTVPEPRITVTQALELYWELAKEKTREKREHPHACLRERPATGPFPKACLSHGRGRDRPATRTGSAPIPDGIRVDAGGP